MARRLGRDERQRWAACQPRPNERIDSKAAARAPERAAHIRIRLCDRTALDRVIRTAGPECEAHADVMMVHGETIRWDPSGRSIDVGGIYQRAGFAP